MHEWALADAVLDTAEKAAKEEKLSAVSEITVCLGELQQIDIKAFSFSLNEIKKSNRPLLAGAKIKIAGEPAEFKCKACSAVQTLEDVRKKAGDEEAEFIHFIPEMAHVYLKCDSCGSPDFDITKGRGVSIKALKGIRQ